MGSSPIDLAAGWALPKTLVIQFRKRLELVDDVRFGCLLQQGITTETTRKGSNSVQKFKATNDLDALFVSTL